MKKTTIKSLKNINDNLDNKTDNITIEQLESRFEIVYTHAIDENTNKIVLVETMVEKTNVKCRITENDENDSKSNNNDTKSNDIENDVILNDGLNEIKITDAVNYAKMECDNHVHSFDFDEYINNLIKYASNKIEKCYFNNVITNSYKQNSLTIGGQ